MRVRRSSDSTTIDVGFDADGNLDTASMLSFVGGGNGTVDIWYDQSGNGYDLTNNSTYSEPIIVASGSLLTRGSNNRPVVANKNNDAVNRMLDTTANTMDWDHSTNKRWTQICVAARTAVNQLFGGINGGTYYVGWVDASTARYYDGSNRNITITTPAANTLGQHYAARTGNTAWEMSVNGGSTVGGTCGNNNAGGSVVRLPLTACAGSWIAEMVHWNSDLSASRAALNTASLGYYGL